MEKISDKQLGELKNAISFMGLADGRVIHESGEIKITDLRAMAAELLELREQTRWIPVGERLPSNSNMYLVYAKSLIFKKSQIVNISFYTELGWELKQYKITHWRPLPLPPQESEKESEAQE